MDFLDRLHRDANKGYGLLPLGGDRDLELSVLLEQALNTYGYEYVRDKVTSDHAPVLTLLAERLASLAVRNDDVSRLHLAIRALGLAGMGSGSRDILLILPVIYRAAELIAKDPEAILEGAIVEMDEAAARTVAAFVNKGVKSIAEMGYVEGEDNGGFRFIRNW